MNRQNPNRHASHWQSAVRRWAVLLMVLLPGLGWAAEVTLAMRYRGEASGKFENMTPPAEFCAVWPARCRYLGDSTFSVDLPIRYQKAWVSAQGDGRANWFVQMPSARAVQVVSDSGHHYTLDFTFTAIAQQVIRVGSSGGVPSTPSPTQSGCRLVESGFDNGNRWSRFLWGINAPQSPQGCFALGNAFGVSIGQVEHFGARYSLIMPRPIGMPQGIYRGSVTYSIGPGGDFDFGDQVSDLSDSQLTVNFELDVQHDLYMQFPPGSDRAVLEPPGGWMAWLGGRGVPSRLYRDLPLRIWSSGPIKLYKRCQYELGGICGIRESGGHMVPVQVAVTLPAGMQHNGGPIERLTVPTHEAAALQIEPVSTVWNQPGHLHFEVAGSDVPSMLAHPGSRYEGLVTVVFEAQM